MEKGKKLTAKLQKILLKLLKKVDFVKSFLLKKFDKLDVKDSNLKKRILTSMVLIPFAIYAIYFSKNFFLFVAISVAILMTFEWVDMSYKMSNKLKWRVIGFFVVLIPIYSIIRLRLIDSDILFWMFMLIWTTDICAYFTGKILEGKKLAPSISPGKTWSGFYGAIVASAIVGLISSLMFVGGALFFVIISIIISIIEQASDLLESKFKRIFGVKDSSNIIPGHGGVLDRLDGVILVAPFILLLVNIFPKQFGF